MAFMACHGGGAANGKVTLGSACTEVGMAFCDRIDACHLTTTGNCFDTFMAGCCTGTACDQQITATQQQVDTCKNDVVAQSCAEIGNGDVPQSCNNI